MGFDPSEELQHLRLAAELSGIDVPEVVLPEGRHVVLGGMRFHYLDWGGGGRPAIIFLHGGALTARTWDVVCLALCRRHRCIALDQRGHGDSEWSPVMDYAPEAHARDLEALADHLGLDRFVLVGQSMGGLNAFVYATGHGERLAGLVVIDTGSGVRLAGAQRIRDFVALTQEIDSLDEFAARAIEFNPLRDPRLLRWSLRRNLRPLPNGKWVRKHDTRWLQREPRDLVKVAEAHWQRASAVRCPVLIVRGALSDVFLDEDAERFARTFPDGRWVRVERAGHNVQGDNPRGLVEALERFILEA